jgi:DNA-binding LacI/PurR family transcriptional regulator
MNSPNEAESSPPGEAVAGETRAPRKLADLQKAITMAQIAKAAGVSQGAISSLLNDRDYGIRVSEKTRERVFKVCREMGYIPNDLRAVVRMYPELGDCCLLIPASIAAGLADPRVARIAGALLAEVSDPARAVTVAVYDETRDYAADAETLPQPVRAGICSKFIALGGATNQLLQALQRRGSAVVSLGHDAAISGIVSIVPDLVQASRVAIEHLHHLGHRQIGIVSGPFGATDPHFLELNRGIRLACDELGIPIDAGMIVHGDLSEKSGRAAVDELLSRQPAPTAIFCLTDDAAAGALAGARARGLDVPRQLTVVGCGDDPRSQVSQPALSTVHLPLEEMARLAVQEIERLVRDAGPPETRRIVVPVTFAARASSGAATPG